MDLVYLKKVLKIIEDADLNEIEINEGDVKIKIIKKPNHEYSPISNIPNMYPQNFQFLPQNAPSAADNKIERKEETKPEEKKYYEIKSPIVGTFYMAPAPDAEPYVKIGQKVSPGTVLCIVEAMKLMNEIESDVSGAVIKSCVENGQPVEYNQTLFQIEKD